MGSLWGVADEISYSRLMNDEQFRFCACLCNRSRCTRRIESRLRCAALASAGLFQNELCTKILSRAHTSAVRGLCTHVVFWNSCNIRVEVMPFSHGTTSTHVYIRMFLYVSIAARPCRDVYVQFRRTPGACACNAETSACERIQVCPKRARM